MRFSTTTSSLTALAMLALAAGAWWWAKTPDGDKAGVARQATPSTARPSKPAAPPKPGPDLLHPQVKTLVSEEAIGYGLRAVAVRELPENLSPQDLARVMDFMNAPKPAEMQDPEWHALVDGLINVLRRQNSAPEGLTDALIRLYHHSADSTLKDYAIQYLRYWFVDREIRYKHETRPDKRERILATLIDAAHKLHESYSGAALMALDHVTTDKSLRSEPETQALIQSRLRDFDELLVKAVGSEETNNLCRISAIQVAAMRGLGEILPAVRSLAADPAADPNLRISAIAAIGQLGDLTEDKELLTRLEKSGQRLAYAAKPALENLARNEP